MNTPLHTSVHNIDESSTSSWPREVTSITNQFNTPLRVQLPRSSPIVQNLYEEIKQSLANCVKDDGDSRHSLLVTTCLDSVLSCVRMLREVKALENDGHGPRPTMSIWAPFIASLASTWSEDVCILSNAPFVLPRSFAPSSSPTVQSPAVEGHATLLLCAAVHPEEEPDDGSEGKEWVWTDEAEDQAKSFSRKTFDEYDNNEGLSEEPLEVPTLDIPFDTHILPGRGRRTDCLLPVICIAEENQINSLVTSVVYQRYVWGISLPTVGICLSTCGTTAKVLIGSISQQDDFADGQLPPVHMYLSKQEADTSMGVFDLLDPTSALHFAEFVLNMRSQFRLLSDLLENAQPTDFCWRLDHVCHSDGSVLHDFETSDHCWKDHIQQWSEDIAWLGPSCPSECLFPINLDTTEAIPYDMSQMLEKTSLLNDTSRNEPMSRSDMQAESSSQFAARRPKAGVISLEPGYELWFWLRGCVRIGCVFVPDEHAPPGSAADQINKMVSLYHDLTKLAWPQGWIEKTQVPCVDEIFKERLQGMLVDLQASMESEDEDKVDFSYLDKGTANFLQSRLSSFFQIIGMAQNVERRRKAGFYFCGKEHHLAWNALLGVFCSSEEDAVPRNLFFDKMIRYPPSNIRPAEATTDRSLSSALAQAHHQRDIAIRQYVHQVDDANSTGDGRRVTLHALGKFESICGHFERSMSTKLAFTPTPSPAPTSAELTEATSKDPACGRIDAMFCLPIRMLLIEPSEAALQSVPADVASTLEPMLPHSYSRFLPTLVVQYGMPTKNVEKLFNKCRMNCVAAVESLSALRVHDLPVFGLAMAGSRVWVLMAWRSTRVVPPAKRAGPLAQPTAYTYVMDHNLASFDISVPTEALQFAVALYRINQHQGKILDSLLGLGIFSKVPTMGFEGRKET